MTKPGIRIEIPRFGTRQIHVVVSDYTGTYTLDGRIVPGVRKRLRKLAHLVDIHILTSDTFGTAAAELKPLRAMIVLHQLPKSRRADNEKLALARQLAGSGGLASVAVLGNGNNDRRVLAAAKNAGGLAIAVDNGEGCATDAIRSANVFVVGAVRALELLLEADRCKATLRF